MRLILLITVGSSIIFLFAGNSAGADSNSRVLEIVVTSDLHGNLGDETNSFSPAGITTLVPLIHSLRQNNPNLILLDAGDTLNGDRLSYYMDKVMAHPVPPWPIIQLMNALEYDAVVPGNHDFDWPASVFVRSIQMSQFPWISANIKNHSIENLFLAQYRIIQRQGLRIGILGLTTPGVPLWVDTSNLGTLVVDDMVSAARHWSQVLKPQVDILIGLFHSGEEADYDYQESLLKQIPMPNASGIIADSISDFDLIIAGHTHKIFPRTQKSMPGSFIMPLILPGSHGEGLMDIQLHLKFINGRWNVTQTMAEFKRPLKKSLTDQSNKTLAYLDPWMKGVNQYFDAKTAIQFVKDPAKIELESCGRQLSYDALVYFEGNGDAAVLSNWKWNRMPKKIAGIYLSRKHLFDWMPYFNKIVRASISGSQLTMLKRLERKKQKRPGRQIYVVPDLDQKKLVADQFYSIWFTNYHWNGGSGITLESLIEPEQKRNLSQQILQEYIFYYLRKFPEQLPEICKGFLKSVGD
ncbi:MAG: metallophosphoesterase [SAR324 cluster bacterium]|nr:metallophosphoesterase [SAR324 cluster bacterium]